MIFAVVLNVAIQLLQIGTHLEGGERSPLFAIRYGNTIAAERASNFYAPLYGPNALNADLWVRAASGSWRRVRFVRPRNLAEFAENQEGFTTFYENAALPPVVARLSSEDLAKVLSVTSFLDGTGMKVYLVPKTTPEEAAGILRSLAGTN